MPRAAPFVRAILALTLLAAGFVVAACGSGKKVEATTTRQTLVARSITAPTTPAIEQAKATKGSIVLQPGSITFTRSAKATIWAVKAGTRVRCQAGPGAFAVGVSVVVPRRGRGAGGTADGSNGSAEIELTHRQDGSITVSCKSSH
jgi:hypothetical protein